MNKIEVFNQLQNEVKDLESSVLEMQNNIKDNKSKINSLIKEILVENIEEIERCVVKWVSNNPIEAISYYIAKELETAIYYKNDNKYIELFDDDNIDHNYGYNLINVSTSKNIKITNRDICDYYSNLSCNGFLELDFLNNYKIELIKETGHFRDECDWSIEYKISTSKIYKDTIYKIIKNNFIINQSEIKKDSEIQLSKENVKI